ncbi:hypothetical protein F5887DRAFT_1079030 [Amanita rubescens]|nr:hypothetical protein F5887DRAFT_1079030 [Amanita rubescens]
MADNNNAKSIEARLQEAFHVRQAQQREGQRRPTHSPLLQQILSASAQLKRNAAEKRLLTQPVNKPNLRPSAEFTKRTLANGIARGATTALASDDANPSKVNRQRPPPPFD